MLDLVESERLSRHDHTTQRHGISAIDFRPLIRVDSVLKVISQSHRQRCGRNAELSSVANVTASAQRHIHTYTHIQVFKC